MTFLKKHGLLRALTAGVATVTLLFACLLFLPFARANAAFNAPKPLSSMMEPAPTGWASEDRSVGTNEYQTSIAASILRYDDAFVRVYRKGETEVTVYVAYWGPGRMDPRLVMVHTPDYCWIGNGARMISRNDSCQLSASGNTPLQPCFFRVFDWSGVQNQVVFWHILGGQPASMIPIQAEGNPGSFNNGALSRMVRSLRVSHFGTLRNDQIFVRISTNDTIEHLTQSDLWPMLVSSLTPAGITLAHKGS